MLANFLSVGILIITGDQAHHNCVIYKLDDGVGAEPGHTCVYREYSMGLRMQPWGILCSG